MPSVGRCETLDEFCCHLGKNLYAEWYKVQRTYMQVWGKDNWQQKIESKVANVAAPGLPLRIVDQCGSYRQTPSFCSVLGLVFVSALADVVLYSQ